MEAQVTTALYCPSPTHANVHNACMQHYIDAQVMGTSRQT